MKFLILNSDYPEFLSWLCTQNPGLGSRSYAEQMQTRNESLFGVADFYSSNLRKLGHEAWDLHVNNMEMQLRWAVEHRVKIETEHWQFRMRRGIVPWVSRVKNNSWNYEILSDQIRHYEPDVLLNFAMDGVSTSFLMTMKPYIRLLVGWIAAPRPQGEDWSAYDLVLTSLPSYVDYFRELGLPSELNRLGFAPQVLDRVGNGRDDIPVSFVGSLSSAHQERISLLTEVSRHSDLQVWGNGVETLPEDSPIRRLYRSEAWGLEMYNILTWSRITLNCHVDIAGSYAANMRLYEATGVGAFLLTDWKANLHEMFEPGKEVVAYSSAEECVELIQYYLGHDDEREAIARAGQERTLREHTYYQRVQELVQIVERHLRHPQRATR